ncbi:MAG: DUF4212 domain-containing protein [Parvularculaceae bacterium]
MNISSPRDDGGNAQKDGRPARKRASHGVAARYWRANVRLLSILLGVWFAVSLGAGVLFVDALNRIEIGGFKLGFWFAQQGSILIFVALIFVYAHRIRRIERELGVDDDSNSRKEAAL